MDPLCDQPASVAPLLRCLEQNIGLLAQSVMQVVLPVAELGGLHLAIDDVLVSVHFEAGSVAWRHSGRTDVLPAEESVVDVPEGFVAARARSAVLLGREEGLLNVGLVSLVVPLEEKLSDL